MNSYRPSLGSLEAQAQQTMQHIVSAHDYDLYSQEFDSDNVPGAAAGVGVPCLGQVHGGGAEHGGELGIPRQVLLPLPLRHVRV